MKIFNNTRVDETGLRASRKAILFNLLMAVTLCWAGVFYFVFHAIQHGPSWWLAYGVLGLFYAANVLAGDPFYFISHRDPNRYAVLNLLGIALIWLPVHLATSATRLVEIFRWDLRVFAVHRAMAEDSNLTEEELFAKYPEAD